MTSTGKLQAFVRSNFALVAATAVSFLVLITFSAGFLLDILYFNDPRNQSEALKPWMTPRYVALSYDLPRATVLELFELTPEDDMRQYRVGRVARRLGLTVPELTERVREAAAAERSK